MQTRSVWVTSGIHALGTWPTCDMQAKPVGVTSGIHDPLYAGQLYMTIMHVLRLRASVSPPGICFRYKGFILNRYLSNERQFSLWYVNDIIYVLWMLKKFWTLKYICSLLNLICIHSESISVLDCMYVLEIFPHWVASSLLRKIFPQILLSSLSDLAELFLSLPSRGRDVAATLSLHRCIHVAFYILGSFRLWCIYVSKSVVIIVRCNNLNKLY